MKQIVEVLLAHDLFGLVAQNRLRAGADVRAQAVGIYLPDDLPGILSNLPEPLLAFTQRCSGPLFPNHYAGNQKTAHQAAAQHHAAQIHRVGRHIQHQECPEAPLVQDEAAHGRISNAEQQTATDGQRDDSGFDRHMPSPHARGDKGNQGAHTSS